MSRWIIAAGAVGCTLLLLIVAGAGTTNAMQAQTPQVITAQAVTAQPILPGDGSAGDIPPGFRPPYGLVLTYNDDGRSFTIPVNSRIFLRIPRLPMTHLVYDPSILQEYDIRPLPYEVPQAVPGSEPGSPLIQPTIGPATAQPPMGAPSDVTPIAPPPIEPPSIMPPFGWQLIAIAPGTTSLALVSTPCPVGTLCPKFPIRSFSVTITVQGVINPPPPIEPPIYPPIYTDIYIGTAYLDQTIPVQVGQVIALDLPFLAAQEPVTLSFDSAVLQPLSGQDLNHPQRGGWRFRVINSGATTILVQGKRCLDGSGDCTPSLLFRVTVASGPVGPVTR